MYTFSNLNVFIAPYSHAYGKTNKQTQQQKQVQQPIIVKLLYSIVLKDGVPIDVHLNGRT
jgi:2-keto-4-pentenoate hydratase